MGFKKLGSNIEPQAKTNDNIGGNSPILHEGDIAMKRIIEVRAAEGGEDSKLFASDLVQAYQKMCVAQNWKYISL